MRYGGRYSRGVDIVKGGANHAQVHGRQHRRGHVAVTLIVAAARAETAAAGSTDAAVLPTVVLVHGAWEQASSWTAVAAGLRDRGYRVLVPDNPLRSLRGESRRALHSCAVAF